MKGTDGAEIKLTLTSDAVVVAVVKASMGDIKENTFLGSAAMPQTDGTQKALEVHLSPSRCAALVDAIAPIRRCLTVP